MKFIAANGQIFAQVVSLSFGHHAGDSMIWLGSTPSLRENTPGGGQRPPTSLPLLLTSREDLQLDSYLEYPPATKALYTYKNPCLLRDSSSGPTAPQSASLTTIPDHSAGEKFKKDK
ncbi:uncharacterized protein TNCV_3689531 [Trichonephila clavipes]|uniref:Uncharacterized protein n=1 Tax=Trichonephila clavipes TaxID=2585209 RepID=A0A8X6VQW1_TRICX|nr:uncharacterized protein TNCV_3689531 [Trichonephila clavipes]